MAAICKTAFPAAAGTGIQVDAVLFASEADVANPGAGASRFFRYAYPRDQTPWQQIQRGLVSQFDRGAVLNNAPEFQRIAQQPGLPRDNH